MLRTISLISSARLMGSLPASSINKLVLEADKVGFMLLNELLKFGCIMLAGKRVGVVAIGQQTHLDVHTLFEQHIDTTDRRFDTCHDHHHKAR